MNTIVTIFKKELLDSVRDRRTLFTMIVIPLLLFPVLITISASVMRTQVTKAQEKTLQIGLPTQGAESSFEDLLRSKKDISLVEVANLETAKELIQAESLDAYIVFGPDFERDVAALLPGSITIFYKATEKGEIEHNRILGMLKEYEQDLRTKRFAQLSLNETIINPVDLRKENLASPKEKLADVIGGFLPYLFTLFCFLGSMYPAIDLAAGEKERGTLETLLTSPAGRFQILMGKFGVVVITGILSAAISMLGLYIGILQIGEIPAELLSTIYTILEPGSIALLLSLLFPLTVFFGAVLLSLSIFAKSFKEAQSIISPLTIFVIIPAFLGMMPGIALNEVTALIPILNVSLATKEILAGTIQYILLGEVYLSLILLAGISLYVCSLMFRNEGIIFRGS